MNLSPEEFFERARKGEFMGAEVTVVDKPVTFAVEESTDESPFTDDGEWYVGDDSHGLYEGYCDTVDYLIVKESKHCSASRAGP